MHQKKYIYIYITSTHPNRIRLESHRMLRIYQRQWQKDNLKKLNKKASKWLKKAGYLGTDDLETIDYNNDTPMDDLETVDFNNDTEMSDLIDLKKEVIEFVKQVPLHPREWLKRKRKAELNNYSKLSKKSENNITFIKQVLVNPRDRLKKFAASNEKVKLMKQVNLIITVN